MARNFDPLEASSLAVSAAKLYQRHLAGKRLLFVATDKHKRVVSLQVSFSISAFQSLTGLAASNPAWSPQTFYSACVDSRLSADAIGIPEGGLSQQKLCTLRQAFVRPDLAVDRIANLKSGHPLLFASKPGRKAKTRWALELRACNGGGIYVPVALLEGDIRDAVRDTYWIVAAYARPEQGSRFGQPLSQAQRIPYSRLVYPPDWGDLPRLTPPVCQTA